MEKRYLYGYFCICFVTFIVCRRGCQEYLAGNHLYLALEHNNNEENLTMNIRQIAKQLIRVELQRQGLGYLELAIRLSAAGYPINKDQIANRLSRGAYKIDFFLQVMKVLSVRQISLDELYLD